jgi:hypothetical protein
MDEALLTACATSTGNDDTDDGQSSVAKQPTIVLTNNSDLESLSLLSNDVQQATAHVVYENDFDMYAMLKDMTNTHTRQNARPRRRLTLTGTQKVRFKEFRKQLTAQLNDVNFTDGTSRWLLHNNYTPIYSKSVQCIGSNMDKFIISEIISLDLQPLSTYIQLMCKLVIIIQGACIERYGPPKLVQDRCIQFDVDHDVTRTIEANTNNVVAKLKRVKSNSCENLLLTVDDDDATKNGQMNIDDDSKRLRNSIAKIKKKRKADGNDDDDGSPFGPITKGTQSEANSDDDDVDANHNQLCSDRQYDLDNYYRHRMSKYSLKDYASIPYYQYSGRACKKSDKATNTDPSVLESINMNEDDRTLHTKDSCTSTVDLISDFCMGYYSKWQLLSEFTLRDVPSTLWNSSACTTDIAVGRCGANDDCSHDDNSVCKTTKTEYYYSCTKEYYVNPATANTNRKPSREKHITGFKIQPRATIVNNSQRTSRHESSLSVPQRPPPPLPTQHLDFRASQVLPIKQVVSRHVHSPPPPLPPRPSPTTPQHISIASPNTMFSRPAKF